MQGIEEELSLVFNNDGIKGFVNWLDTAKVSSNDLIEALDNLEEAGNLQIKYKNPTQEKSNNNNKNNETTSWKDKINSFFVAKNENTDDTSLELANNMLGLTKTITQNTGAAGEMINGMTGVISGMFGLTSGIGTITTVITTLIAILKAQQEYAMSSLDVERWGGNTEIIKEIANQFGEDQKAVLKASSYALKAGATEEDISKILYLTRGQATAEEAIKSLGDYLRGNSGSLAQYLGGSARSNIANNALLNVYAKTGNTSGAYNVMQKNLNQQALNLDQYKTASDKINFAQQEWNRAMNGINSAITEPNVFTMNREVETKQENKVRAQKVEVINSIMLDDRTVNELTKLREHNYLINVDLEHTTPINNYNIKTEIGGKVNNAEEVSNLLAREIEQLSNTGAKVNNTGGY